MKFLRVASRYVALIQRNLFTFYKLHNILIFGQSWDNSYIHSLVLMIEFHFTCGEGKYTKTWKASNYFVHDCRFLRLCGVCNCNKIFWDCNKIFCFVRFCINQEYYINYINIVTIQFTGSFVLYLIKAST